MTKKSLTNTKMNMRTKLFDMTVQTESLIRIVTGVHTHFSFALKH